MIALAIIGGFTLACWFVVVAVGIVSTLLHRSDEWDVVLYDLEREGRDIMLAERCGMKLVGQGEHERWEEA